MKKKRSIPWDLSLSAGENARLHLPLVVHEFFSEGRAVAGKAATPPEMHAFRLAAKRLRYTFELFRPLYGPGLETKLEAVRRIQSLLGKRQDCAVLSARIREQQSAGESLLHALTRIEARGLKLEEEFRSYWRTDFDKPGEELRWARYLARRPRQPA
jgi:CHAD domain-containing protein